MTPREYLESCYDPAVPYGYACCLIDKGSKENKWTIDQVVALKQTIEQRHKESAIFPFPRKVRYV